MTEIFLQKNMAIYYLFTQLNTSEVNEKNIAGIENFHISKPKMPQLKGTVNKAEKLIKVNNRNPIPYFLYL
jgi:hypothetical protein